MNYANLSALKGAIKDARDVARKEGRQSCGKGVLQSRGAYLKMIDANGNIIQGEAESWPFIGNAKEFKALADLIRYSIPAGAHVEVGGGFNFAASVRDLADNYDPWVSEWCLEVGAKAA